MKDVFLSVIIPCYDEMANLQKGVLDKVINFLKKKKFTFEVIIVDDGSSDGSVQFIEKFIKDQQKHVSLIKNQHTGKAGAVTSGMLAAKGEIVMFSDMDQATPIEEVDNLLPFFDQGYDVVIGSRKDRRKGSPWTRLLMSRVWMLLRNITIGLGIEDTQCGFKMFRHEAAKQIFTKLNKLHNGFAHVSGSSVSAGFDVELLYLAELMNYKIREVPVQWLYVETRRVNIVKDSLDGLQYLFHIRLNQLSGKYK